MDLKGQIVRILLRYLAMFIAAKGVFAPGFSEFLNDPAVAQAVEVGVGLSIGALTEAWWWIVVKWQQRKAARDASRISLLNAELGIEQ